MKAMPCQLIKVTGPANGEEIHVIILTFKYVYSA